MDTDSTVLEVSEPEAKPVVNNELPQDILALSPAAKAYQESDVFAWANNLVQFKDELKIDLYLINKQTM